MNLEDLLNCKTLPKKDDLTDEDLARLFIKYKGLLKKIERDKAFWAATNENLKRAYSKLDELVEERTIELKTVNEQLQQELNKRKRAEEKIKEYSEKLEKKVLDLEKSIIERKRAEKNIKESEQRFSSAINSLNHPFYVIDTSDYTIKLMNSSTKKHYREVTQPITCYKLTHNEDKPCSSKKHKCPLKEVINTKKPATTEHQHYREDGSVIILELHCHPIFDQEGKVSQAIVYSIDITKRKQIENRLKEYSEQLEEMVEQRIRDIQRQNEVLEAINKVFQEVLICEDEAEVGNTCLTVAEELTESKFGFIGLINKEGLFDTIAISDPGYAACKVPGTDQIELITNMTLDGIDRSTMQEEKSRIINDPVNHPDRKGVPKGHPPITAFLGVPLKHEGKTIGMIGLANKEDGYQITDQESIESLSVAFVEALKKKQADVMVEQTTKKLREAQEELIRKEQLAVLGHLAGGVSHELRNPLGVIKNAVYFLNMVLEESEPEVKEILEILDKEIVTSENIISGLLDFARPKPLSLQKVDINDVVQKVLSRITVPNEVKVLGQLNKALPSIEADLEQLTQVFNNIISNAIQAMPEGGQLVIKSEAPTPSWVTISIEDTGVGIPEENLEKIFEPLFTTKAKGIGLGLAVTKTLVEEHGGSIEVQSEAGKGSTFTVKLPTSQQEDK